MTQKNKSNNFDFKGLVECVGFKYKKHDLYKIAFTHTTYSNEHKIPSNERLEYLGDAILDFLFAEYLYNNYPNMPEGEMSKIRAKYVLAEANAEYSKALGLNKFVLLGHGEEEQGGRDKISVLGDLFEAFLGALYLDNKSLDEVRKILNRVIFSKIEYIDKSGYFKDYKSILQEFIQAESRNSVYYELDSETGPSHNKTFVMSVFHEGIKLGEGVGRSKKEAEQEAAKKALEKLVK